jgi:hypothetical protein
MTPQPAVVRLNGGDADRLPEDTMLHLIQDFSTENGTADVDISGSDFDFVRSIRVFNTTATQRHIGGSDGTCERSASVALGSYGRQGNYSWSGSSLSALPAALTGLSDYGSDCPRIAHRSVFIDWRDYEGNYGYEQVNY